MKGESQRTRFERVLRENGPALSRVVASYARPGAEREDLAQDVALALWRALPLFRGESSERSFALRVAHNRGMTHLSRRPSAGGEPPELADPAPLADAQLARREASEALYAAIRKLPVGQRMVLTLALEDLPHAEIAKMLGITAENVAVKLSRARASLRALLSEEKP